MQKLRIASYYENRLGRNDGNPVYMWNAFKSIGVESGHMVPWGDVTKLGTWDLHFEADWGEDALKGVLPYQPIEIPKPSAFWHSDTHLGYDWRLEKAKRTDFNFVCQKRALEDFTRDGIPNVIWMPHAAEPSAYPTFAELENSKQKLEWTEFSPDNQPPIAMLKKQYDLGFVGHINSENRIEALDKMFKAFPKFFFGQRTFEAAAEIYHDSKIVFNISIEDDINMRVFEALCSKSFLLTNWIPTLGELFEDGKHLVMYRTIDEAIEKARYYLEHEDERNEIAEAGFREVRAKHLFRHRAKQVLDVCLPGWDQAAVAVQPELVAAV